jgi:hypothetical protein
VRTTYCAIRFQVDRLIQANIQSINRDSPPYLRHSFPTQHRIRRYLIEIDEVITQSLVRYIKLLRQLVADGSRDSNIEVNYFICPLICCLLLLAEYKAKPEMLVAKDWHWQL